MIRLIPAIVFLVFQGTAGAAEVIYARSNGDLQGRQKPGRYSALNMLDDNQATVWCSEGTGKGAKFEVVFSEKVEIDRIDFRTGNQKSAKTFGAFSRVRQMKMAEEHMAHTVDLMDESGVQTLKFDPVLNTRRLTFRLEAGYRGKAQRHSCISDIIFYTGRRPLNGKKLKKYIVKRRKALVFIDTWVSGPEFARNRELIFGVKGNYYFKFVPSDPMEEMVRVEAPFRLKDGNPELKVGKKWVPVRVSRDDAGRVLKIKIERSEDAERVMPGVYTRHGEQFIE